jgi:hypothetical protein
MTTEELARQAGASAWDFGKDRNGKFLVSVDGVGITEELERFAALVREQALEDAAKVCDGKERRKWEILTVGGTLEGFGPLDCAHAIRALK